MMKTTNDLIREIYDQAQTPFPPHLTLFAHLRIAFDDGATITELSRIHKDWDEEKGRVYPFPSEKHSFNSPTWSDFGSLEEAVKSVAYTWYRLGDQDQSLKEYSHWMVNFFNALESLFILHPDYNLRTGSFDSDD